MVRTIYKKEEEQGITESRTRVMVAAAAVVVTLAMSALVLNIPITPAYAQVPVQIGIITPIEEDEEEEEDSRPILTIGNIVRESASTAGSTGTDAVTTEATTIPESLGLTIGETTQKGSGLMIHRPILIYAG